MSDNPDTPSQNRMQFPEYIKRELSEVYLLMDHVAGRQDLSLDAALAPHTTGGKQITLKDICDLAWPPSDHDRAETLAVVLTAKDRLSHAVFPATGHSIAFTLLSTAYTSELTHSDDDGAATPDVESPAGIAKAARKALRTSTILQFARDAYPGLEAKCTRRQKTMQQLLGVLVVLLVVTCGVSWDLAIGQRLLSDYRWLAEHPTVLLIDQKDVEDIFCPKGKGEADSGEGKAADAVPQNGATPTGIGACSRYQATVRVRPMMDRWDSWQFVLRWLVSDGSPRGTGVLDTARAVEETRLLVTTINYNVLPLVLGALAAAAAALRGIFTKIAGGALDPRDLMQIWPRVVLGAFLGAVIGLLDAPGASNGLFTLVGGSGVGGSGGGGGAVAATSDTVALSPAAYAFLAGFATGRIFRWLDDLVERIFAFASPKPPPAR